MIGEKSEKKILKKEIAKHLKETHNHIVQLTKETAKENTKLMLEKIEELKGFIKQAVKEEVENELKRKTIAGKE